MSDIFNYGHHYGMGVGGTMFGGMGVISIVFWFLLLAGIFLILRGLLDKTNGPGSLPPTHESASDILEKRFAKGEIDESTFKRMKKDLEE